MADEISEPTEVVEVSEEQRITNAMEKLGDLGKTEPQEVETQEETQEKPEEKVEKESKSKYYLRMLEVEKENRKLKQQLKTNPNSSNLKEQAQKDPMAVLNGLGLDINQILDLWVDQQNTGEPLQNAPTEQPEVQEHQTPAEVLKLQQQLEALQKNIEAKEYSQQVNAEFSKLDAMILPSEDRWEAVRELRDEGSYDLVLETASELYKINNEIPTYEVVLDMVEEHLLDNLKQRWAKLEKVNKIKPKIEPIIKNPTNSESLKQKTSTLFDSSSSAPVSSNKNDEEARFNAALKALGGLGD